MIQYKIRCDHYPCFDETSGKVVEERCSKKAVIAFRFKTQKPVFLCAKHACEDIDYIWDDYLNEDDGGSLP